MKKLTSKKGFTLIEMLVVIAIIAILVAIIVPTVTRSTDKAKAATDAANLRSAEAEANIYVLQNDIDISGDEVDLTSYVSSAACKTTPTDQLKVVGAGDKITATFGSNGIQHFADIANGSAS